MPIDLFGNRVLESGVTINGDYNKRITREGLILYLDAGDLNSYPGTGTVWYDLSEYGHDATITGSPTWGTVSGTTAFTHTVFAQWYSGSLTSSVAPTLQCTIETWIALSGSEIAGGSVDRGCIFVSTGGSGIYHSYNRSSYDQSNYWYSHYPEGYHESGAPLSIQKWQQVVGVWDNRNMYQWVDGVLTSVSNVVGTSSASAGYNIGSQGGTSRSFAGSYGIVRLYNRALHPYEIGENFQANKRRFGL